MNTTPLHDRAQRLSNLLLTLLFLLSPPTATAQSIALLPTTYNPLAIATSVYQSIVYVQPTTSAAAIIIPQTQTVVQTIAAAPVTTTVVQVVPVPVVVTTTATAYLTSAYCMTTLAGWSPAQTAVCPAAWPVGCGSGVGLSGWCCGAGSSCQTYAVQGKLKRDVENDEEEETSNNWGVELRRSEEDGIVERGVVNEVGCCPWGKTCRLAAHQEVQNTPLTTNTR